MLSLRKRSYKNVELNKLKRFLSVLNCYPSVLRLNKLSFNVT